MNKKYFTINEAISQPNKCLIGFNLEEFPIRTKGSFNVLAARVMGLSYVEYLRMCRDVLGAEIIGKNSTYPVPCFKKTRELVAFVRLLNVRFNCIVWEKEHPDWEEHAEIVAARKEERAERLEVFKENVDN
jgi:hypothetical protein